MDRNRCRFTALLLGAAFGIAACGDTDPMTGPVPSGQPERTEAVPASFVAPVVAPVMGTAIATTIDVGDEALHSETATSATVAGASATSTNDFAASTVSLTANETETAHTLSARHDMMVDPGGALSQGFIRIEFDVLEEVAYELRGGLSGSADTGVRFSQGTSLHQLNPRLHLFREDDDTAGSSADFTIDGVAEGNLPPNPDLQPFGPTTGVLSPGSYQLSGGSWIVSDGGSTATATADYVIILRPSVTTATQRALALVDELDAAGILNSGQVRSLEARLDGLVSDFGSDQLSFVLQVSAGDEEIPYLAKIDGMIRQVRAWVEAGRLPASEGESLVAALQLIRNALEVELRD